MFPRHRLCVFLLVFSLLLQAAIPFQIYANEDINTVSKKPKISLEQAIRIVKENFQIPKNFTEFRSGYNSYDDRQAWSLSWNNSDGQNGRFSAQVDAASGEILSISTWSSSKPKGYALPNISLEQAEKIAEETLEKLTGSKYKQLQMIKDETAIPLNLYSSQNYSFTWQRIENGLPVQGNGASIQIDGDNGQVVSYRLTWTDLEFPEPKNIISELQATKVFREHKFLNLEYFTPFYIPLNTKDPKQQVKLVYRLKENGILDAFSGKPLPAEQNLPLGYDDLGLGNMDAKQAARESIALTPEELREIEENASLLTAEQAMAVVKEWFDIPANYTLRAMNLNKDNTLKDSKVWYFEWGAFDEKLSQNIFAKVDAANGELISFRYYKPVHPLTQESAQTPKISQAEAKNIAEDFLKKIQPVKFTEVRIINSNSPDTPPVSVPETGQNPSSITFSYERIVDGITFGSNGMNITVDLNTKKITSYNLNWWDLTFPKVSEAMSQNKAEENFLKARPLVLTYMLVYNNGNRQAKLVYMPAAEQNKVSDIMDAQTGELLNWQGTPLSDPSPRYVFNDIAGHEAEKEISVLGLAGIFGEYGNSFEPASDLTLVPLLKALLMINSNSSSNIYNLTDEAVLKEAKEQGWFKEDLTASQTVSRELFSKIIIHYLGLEKIAEIKDIYNLKYKDSTNISRDSAGYIALATGLNFIESNNSNKLEPRKILNRAEAARCLIKVLEYKSAP